MRIHSPQITGSAENTNIVTTARITSLSALSASFASTASSADNLTVRGTLTAQTINVQTITSSIDYVTGSSINGSLLANTHQFTGSVLMTGSNHAIFGNVGIGTTSPSYSLDVNGNTKIGSVLLGSTSLGTTVSGLYLLTDGNNAVVSTYYYNSILSLKAGVSGSSFPNTWSKIELKDGNNGSGYINFFTSGSSRMYINQVGNVGINTTTPASGTLHVNGNIFATSFTGSLQGTSSYALQANSASFALTASYISGSGAGVGFPFSGSAIITGSLFVSGSTISGSFVGDGSGITGLTAGGKIHTQTSAASTWTFSHNLGVQYPNVTVYDNNNNVIIPQTIVATDANTLTLTFGSAVAGYAVAGIGGIINVQGRTTQQYFTASTTWSFAHNLGDKYVSLQAFDDAFEMMIPTTIRLVDFTSSLLLFDSASSGYAVATIGGDLPAISSSYAGYTLQVANSAPYSASWVAVPNVTVTNAVSSSFAATASLATTASFAATASSADNLTVRSTLTLPTGTTAQRSGSPNTGSIRFNTSITAVEYFSGTTWQGVNSYSSSTIYPVELLVVGGGGGGGCGERTNSAGGGAGGGGAGGYIATTAMIITGSSNPIIVGTGGAGSSVTSTTGATGGDSGAFNFRAAGGGAGIRDETQAGDQALASGGSGGGAGGDGAYIAFPGLGIYGQGNNGNAGYEAGRCSGGGGGAQTGSIAYGVKNTRASGAGGNGLTWLNGSTYAGGGGGGAGGLDTATSSGGTGGGGAGSSTDGIPGTNNGGGGTATAGTANTGGGGGGGAAGRAQGGQNGGSGIVIIRYQGTQRGLGGTVSSSNGYTYHTFTTSGTFIG